MSVKDTQCGGEGAAGVMSLERLCFCFLRIVQGSVWRVRSSKLGPTAMTAAAAAVDACCATLPKPNPAAGATLMHSPALWLLIWAAMQPQ